MRTDGQSSFTLQARQLPFTFQLVNSASGPSASMAQAIWHSDDTTDQVELLWHDPNLVTWDCKRAYRWEMQHRPDIGVIRSVTSYCL